MSLVKLYETEKYSYMFDATALVGKFVHKPSNTNSPELTGDEASQEAKMIAEVAAMADAGDRTQADLFFNTIAEPYFSDITEMIAA